MADGTSDGSGERNTTAPCELVPCGPSGPDYDAVKGLLKSAQKTVGALPFQAVRERAERGTLLLAKRADDVVGYVLYDLRGEQVKIVQLVVAPSERGAGVGRQLVDEVQARHPDRSGILLWCRRDYGLEPMWSKLGFVARSNRRGRSKTQETWLTGWWRDFGQPNLFTFAIDEDERPIAVLDNTAVIDLADGKHERSGIVLLDEVSVEVRLAVTAQLHNELNDREDPESRDRHMAYAQTFDQISSDHDAEEKLYRGFVQQLGAAKAAGYAGDLRHVAQAAAGGARWFITSDDRFKKACSALVAELSGLRVMDPVEFVLDLDRLTRGDTYCPVELQGTDVLVRRIEARDISVAAQRFVNQRAGETHRQFRRLLETELGRTDTTEGWVVEADRQLVGLIVFRRSHAVSVPIVRVLNKGPAPTFARQILGWLRANAPNDAGAPMAIHVSDRDATDAIASSFDSEGFLPAAVGATALVIPGMGAASDLAGEVTAVLSTLTPDETPTISSTGVAGALGANAVADLERVFHPYRVLGAGLPTFCVPIKAAWASDLFDSELSSSQLFPRQRGLALSREHVYYRKPISSGGLVAPARIVWYASGSGPGGKTLRGTSLLREISIDTPERLHRRFRRLGVYEVDQVRGAAADGRAMALRFTHTQLFDRPVTLDEYEEASQAVTGKKVAVAGPQPVDERVFAAVCRMAT